MRKFGDHSVERGLGAGLRAWGMMSLMLIFVALYGAALLGWFMPLTDDKLIRRLEPLIFVILGYYFGRLPSQQNENTLKEEMHRQTQRADAAQHAKEQAQRLSESLEEKLKNVRVVLAASVSGSTSAHLAENIDQSTGLIEDHGIRQSIAKALDILNS